MARVSADWAREDAVDVWFFWATEPALVLLGLFRVSSPNFNEHPKEILRMCLLVNWFHCVSRIYEIGILFLVFALHLFLKLSLTS